MDNEIAIQIVQKLASILLSSPISLEILPGGLEEWASADIVDKEKLPSVDFPFLYLEGNLGVPKKVLYQLYMTAITLFRSSRYVPELCNISSSIILLTNPAHQTALNARKRLVQSGVLHPDKELQFTELLLRGSSDCAKQSILWDHRRWLFGKIYHTSLSPLPSPSFPTRWKTSSDLQNLPNIPSTALNYELSIIRAACEAHPRNYHAWTYWHFIIDVVYKQLILVGEFSEAFLEVLSREFQALTTWIDLHVSDHSSVFRICSLGALFEDIALRYPSRENIMCTRFLVDHAFSLVIAYPSHESLWIYLRESASSLPAEQRQRIVEKVESSSVSENPFAKMLMDRILAHATAKPRSY